MLFTVLNIDSLIGLAVQTTALQVVVVVGAIVVDGVDRRSDACGAIAVYVADLGQSGDFLCLATAFTILT